MLNRLRSGKAFFESINLHRGYKTTSFVSKAPIYAQLKKNDANYIPLSPITFIEHTALSHPNATAYMQGGYDDDGNKMDVVVKRKWGEVASRGIA